MKKPIVDNNLTPNPALCLWWLIPQEVRDSLRCRTPLSATEIGNVNSLAVAVGSGVPLRWLVIKVLENGLLEARLWAVGPTQNHYIARKTIPSDELVMTLSHWGMKYLND